MFSVYRHPPKTLDEIEELISVFPMPDEYKIQRTKFGRNTLLYRVYGYIFHLFSRGIEGNSNDALKQLLNNYFTDKQISLLLDTSKKCEKNYKEELDRFTIPIIGIVTTDKSELLARFLRKVMYFVFYKNHEAVNFRINQKSVKEKFNVNIPNEYTQNEDPMFRNTPVDMTNSEFLNMGNFNYLRSAREQLHILNQIFCNMGNSIINTDKKMNTKVMSKMEEVTGKYMPESVAENLQNYAGTEFNVELMPKKEVSNFQNNPLLSEVDGGRRRKRKYTKKRKLRKTRKSKRYSKKYSN